MSRDPAPERPEKRSLTLQGHRTSVSLETAFWEAFRRIAAERGASVNGLAAEIDAARTPPGSLASAIRVFVLRDLQDRLATERPGLSGDQPIVPSTGKVSSSQ